MTRLESIDRNAGFTIVNTYAFNLNGMYFAPTQAQIDASKRLTGAQGGNSHGGPGPLPSVAYSNVTTNISGGYHRTNDITDGTGRTSRSTTQVGSAGNFFAYRRPGSTVDDMRVDLDGNYLVTSILRDGATWSYNFAAVDANTVRLTVTGPTGRVRKYDSDPAIGMPKRIEDEYGRVTQFVYDATTKLLQNSTSPGGQLTSYLYDGEGNVTSTTTMAVGGGTLSTAASYSDVSCDGGNICNRIATSTDLRGVVTSYGYGSHGLLESVITANSSGTAPSTQTRYSQVGGIWLPTSTWNCRTQASCENSADAVKVTTAYNANLLPETITQGAGDGSLSATTTLTYTAAGDVSTVDGPLAGADVTRSYYDAARRPLGSIGPDPDDGGPRSHGAVRYGYDAAGRQTAIESGTASDQSDSALSSMSVLQTQTATLDAAGRTVSQALSAGGTTSARVDYKYDAAGYITCAAQRMNPAALGSAQDACAVGGDAGYGPDRVTLTQYSPFGAGQPARVSVTSAYGTAEAATEVVEQTAAGQTGSITDGNGNVTSIAYDGFGRPFRTCYQVSTSGACAGSPADYDQTNYAANGDVSGVRLRDGRGVTFGYDGLGRRSSTAFSNPVDLTDSNQSYQYDLLGRLTLAADGNGHNIGYAYDALGRLTNESGPWGSLSSQYDVAGRRTRLTWGDGFYVTYEHDTVGAMTAIRENGGFVLASFGYDDLGRRVSRSLGNGTSTSYGYDAVSRLTALNLNGGGQADAVTLGYNPASQIATRTSANDAFAWTGAVNLDRNYATNGLNQYTASGNVTPTYDARGNLTSAGGASYLYNSKNQLSGANGTYLYYDAVGRLDQVTQSGLTWEWDGSRLVTERSGGGIVKRYIHGPGADEPIVQYDGAGTGQRRWLDADERGSIVRVTDDAGGVVAVNAYDEYGIPGAANYGRFQYTGQMWMPELGFYHYKARMYSPTLGRFLQTDPIGYGDGINWYEYVGGDPVNSTDPTGMDALCGFGRRAVLNRDSGNGQRQTSKDEVMAGYRCDTDPDEIARWTQEPLPYFGPLSDPSARAGRLSPRVILAPSRQKARPVDYCGSKGSEGVPDGLWGGACKKHDDCYGTPGNSKERCDINLGRDITLECTRRSYGVGAPLCLNIGLLYSGGLIALGWTPWYHPSRDAYNSAQKVRAGR